MISPNMSETTTSENAARTILELLEHVYQIALEEGRDDLAGHVMEAYGKCRDSQDRRRTH